MKKMREKWKRAAAMVLAAVMMVTLIPTEALAGTSSDNGDGTFANPVIYSDVPDIDIIRVGDVYYMVSTTMHLSPGCPVMKSTDLVNWEIVNYVYDTLGDADAMNLRNGESMYGNGQWAASLKYYGGTYYVAFNCNTTGEAYLYTTDDIERGAWNRTTLNGFYHDMSLFIDDNGKGYILYGGGEIKCAELSEDFKTVKIETEKTLFDIKSEQWPQGSNIGTNLAGEGTHIMKKGEYYYVFNICWPKDGVRTEVCHRSKTFPSTEWENQIILKTDFQNNGVGGGVAQGAVIDTPDGKWYGFLFQDHGAIGRVPVLTDCTWKNDWPMLGRDGDGRTVETVMQLPAAGSDVKSLVKSDEFYNDAEHRVFETSAAGKTAVKARAKETAYSDDNGIAAVSADDGSLIQLIENGGFETGDASGWQITRTEEAKIEVTTEEKASGTYSAHVFDRKTTGAGACQNISGKLEKGRTYTISGKIKYTTGPDTKQFNVTVENGDNFEWREDIIHIQAVKGEWTEFTGTYTVHDKNEQHPFDNEQNYIFIETPWVPEISAENDLMDYYLDDFSVTTESYDKIVNGSFEKGIEPWTGMEDANISISTEEAQDGEASVATTGRTACAQGPCQDLSNKLTPGNTYTITAYIKYNTGVNKKKFNVTIQNGPDFSYRSILGSVTAEKGEWAKLETTYTMPVDADSTQNYLFFETDWVSAPTAENDLMDFYVDHVSMVEQVNEIKETEEPGESDYNGSNLDLVWQWNHNPNNNDWSLTERNGWLRLTTGKTVPSILQARNTLTQRTYGPTCSGRIKMDIANMKTGDVAGLSAFSYNYGYIAVKKESEGAKLVMVDASANALKGEDAPEEKASIDCEGNTVYLKADFNFAGGDKVRFYYSFDGSSWKQLGNEMQLGYELTHFMGSRFALFNYATRATGGYVDFDYFRVSDNIAGESQAPADRKAEMSGAEELAGVINNTYEVKLTMDALEAGNHSGIKASIAVPDIMDVEDVVFNTSAIKGSADYTFKNHRLTLNVSGNNVSFSAADKLFATIKLKLNNYADEDKEVSLKADYIMADNGALEYDVADCAATVKLKYLDTGAIAKKLGYGNPIMTQEFGADPYAIVYDGRVYVYMTADDFQYAQEDCDVEENGTIIHYNKGDVMSNNFDYIKSLRVVSSEDLMNWTDHGEIKVAGEDGAAKWAAHAWAPAVAYKQIEGKDKFFLYFANDASGIGVLEADTPLGPWKDPIGKALLTGQTPGCEGVVWCFDPAVLVDDDGSAYIYFGGGIPGGKTPTEEQINNPMTARVAKLGDDMVSIDGKAELIDAPCMFEDGGIFKYNGRYYYSYCSNFASPHKAGYPGYGNICYMVSDNPMGPYTYAGEIFSNPNEWFGVGGNNHHATFVFEGESYFIYHAQTVSKSLGVEKGYRSTHIDKINLNRDGSIRPIKGTYAGISQLHEMNPYERIDAETIAWNAGIKVTECKEAGKLFGDYNMALTDLQDGDWTSVSQVNFGTKGAEKFQVSAASANGGSIEVRLDSPDGTLIGTAQIDATENEDTYQTVTCDVADVTGIHNVFLVFRGSESGNIMNVDYYQFTEKAGGGTPPGPGKPPKVNETFTASNGLKYKVTAYGSKNKSVAVTGLSKKVTTVTIPAAVKYKKVTFKVTSIGSSAFTKQSSLKSAVIGKNVTSIGSKAFYNDKKLSKVTFKGTAVKTIGKDAFKGINKKATFHMAKKTFASKNVKYKITKCTASTKEVSVTGASKKTLASLNIPATVKYNGMTFKVTTIGKKAFRKMTKLKSVTVGKNVKSIGANAFEGDKKLAKVKFSGTAVKSIGKNAFKGIKKNAVFSVKKSKKAYYRKLLKKAKTKNFKVK